MFNYGLPLNLEVQSLDPKIDIVDWFVLSCFLQIILEIDWLAKTTIDFGGLPEFVSYERNNMEHFIMTNFVYVDLRDLHT